MADGNGRIDHYAAHQRVTVKSGQTVAKVCPATDGEDGRGVTGQAIKAKPGRSLVVKIDRSLLLTATNDVVAQSDGILQLEGGMLRVNQVLQIEGSVDFNTGNIDFVGSVDIKEGIRDRFAVKTTGDITIGGLVEGATIHCGGNLVVRRGIAAKDHGQLMVAGQAEIGFLNNIRGQIGGSLIVQREVLNSDLIVGGDFRCEGGAVIGGLLIITGNATIATLGSEAYTTTVLHLGEVPMLSMQLRKLDQFIMRGNAQISDKRQKSAHLDQYLNRLTATEKGTLTELNREIDEMQRKVNAVDAKRTEILEKVAASRSVNVQVLKMVYPHVTLRAGGNEVRFNSPLKGPVKFSWNEDRQLQYRVGEGPAKPITDVAHVIPISPRKAA